MADAGAAGFRVGKAIRFTAMPVYVCQPGFKYGSR